MSLQTTEARFVARALDAAWRNHRRSCPRCQTAARRRRWAALCDDGSRVWRKRGEAHANVAEQQRLDRLPTPGQGTLDFEGLE